MSRKITGREADPEVIYADIFRLPHHVSDRHPQMSLHDRAAQFAPYAALTGYDDMVSEEARQTDSNIVPGTEPDRLNACGRKEACGFRHVFRPGPAETRRKI